MVPIVRRVAGWVFGVSVAGLIPFFVERNAEPKGHAVLWILYGALGISALIWLATSLAVRLDSSRRSKPLEIVYSLDGSQDLRAVLRRGHPQSILLSVGFKNPNPYNLEGVAINSLFPQGLGVTRCGAHGEPLENPKGHWLTTPEKLSDEPPPGAHKDYWADENVTISGNGSKLMFFKMRLVEPGSHYLLTRLFGNVPEQEQAAMLEVVETESQTFGGVIGELICDGERMTPPGPVTAHWDIQPWMEQLAFLTGMLPDEDHRWWRHTTADAPPGGSAPGQDRLAISSRLPALYDLRKRLDRAPQPPTNATAASKLLS